MPWYTEEGRREGTRLYDECEAAAVAVLVRSRNRARAPSLFARGFRRGRARRHTRTLRRGGGDIAVGKRGAPPTRARFCAVGLLPGPP